MKSSKLSNEVQVVIQEKKMNATIQKKRNGLLIKGEDRGVVAAEIERFYKVRVITYGSDTIEFGGLFEKADLIIEDFGGFFF